MSYRTMILYNLVLAGGPAAARAEEVKLRWLPVADGALWHRARSVLGLQQPRAAVGVA
jgi:hypothetical protein